MGNKNLNRLTPWDWPEDASEMLLKVLADPAVDKSE